MELCELDRDRRFKYLVIMNYHYDKEDDYVELCCRYNGTINETVSCVMKRKYDSDLCYIFLMTDIILHNELR